MTEKILAVRVAVILMVSAFSFCTGCGKAQDVLMEKAIDRAKEQVTEKLGDKAVEKISEKIPQDLKDNVKSKMEGMKGKDGGRDSQKK
jgi:hypothetical protein